MVDAQEEAIPDGWVMTMVPKEWLDPRDEVNGRVNCDCYSCAMKHKFQEAIAARPVVAPPANANISNDKSS